MGNSKKKLVYMESSIVWRDIEYVYILYFFFSYYDTRPFVKTDKVHKDK